MPALGRPRRLAALIQCDRIIVPYAWSLRISSSIACGTRPSMMCTRVDAALGGIECAGDLGQHAARQRAVGEQLVDLARAQVGQQLAVLVEHAGRVGQQHQLLGLQHLGQLAGHDVGVDVVALVVFAEADRRDHRNELIVLQRAHHAGVDGDDVADLADVVLLARIVAVHQLELARAHQPAVAAGQAHRLAAGVVDEADDVLLHLAGQHPLDDFHRLLVGHAHALDERALLAQTAERLLDLWPAAVHHHRIEADQLEQHHVLGKVLLQRRIGHRVAAVLDDDGLAVEASDVRQRLRQQLGLLARRDVGQIGGRDRGRRHAERAESGMTGL